MMSHTVMETCKLMDGGKNKVEKCAFMESDRTTVQTSLLTFRAKYII